LSTKSIDPFSPTLPEHLHEQKFWEFNQPALIELGKNLTSPQNIFELVVEKLDYTSKPLEQDFARLGAADALKEEHQNDLTCQEFTDLFIALARQKQIPARRVVGIAYSNNEELRPSNLNHDILHTWPEYYDQEQQDGEN
jgi:transglutaminase-like putative cysteine protease